MKYVTEVEGRELICEFGRRMYARGLVSGNEGNLSCRIDDNVVLMTPTLESKGYMTPEMMIKMDLNGEILEDTSYRPSSEHKMHLGMFQENPKTCAVIHAHSMFSTAFSCSDASINNYFLPEALGLFGKEIKKAKYAVPGTMEVPESVKPFARTDRVVLMANHGVLAWGKSLKDAYFALEILENYCKFHVIGSNFIGQMNQIPNQNSINALLKEFSDNL